MALLASVYTQTYPSDVTDAEWAVLEPLVTPTTRLAMSERPRRLRRDCIPNRQPHHVLSRGDMMVIHLLSLSVGSGRVGVGLRARVLVRARGRRLAEIALRELLDGVNHAAERPSLLRQAILDARRNLGEGATLDKFEVFQHLQPL